MNDASADPVQDHFDESQDREKPLKGSPLHEDSSRLWFLSSGFPMIAGTLGPVASAFSICALVRPWRQVLPPGAALGTGVDQAPYLPDPTWLDVINAVQLAIALVSNVFLLLNMTRRIRFSIAQPITFVGWYISAFALLALSTTALGPLNDKTDEFVWSQAFWYGIWSAILYFIVATLMLCTFFGASRGWYHKDFYLTPSQRTLMLQTIMFLLYMLVGALVFSHIEGWGYLDAVYWANVTLFTVGFGDFAASTVLGRALLFPYALIGIISLGLVIGSIRSLVIDRGQHKLDARMVEKKRRKMVKKLTKQGKDEILEPIPNTTQLGRSITNEAGLTELERRNEEFKLMRRIQHEAAVRRRWTALAVSTSTTAVLWLVGAKIFEECEKDYQPFDYFTGVYFAFVSLTTIGYGDVTPQSNAGKSFFVFWSLLALPTMTVLISNAGDTVVKVIRDATDQLGTITILPGEHGIKKEIKRLFPGRLFGDGDTINERPPGFLGASRPVDSDSDDDTADEEDGAIEGKGREDEEHGPLKDRDHPGGASSSSTEKPEVEHSTPPESPGAEAKANGKTAGSEPTNRSGSASEGGENARTSQSPPAGGRGRTDTRITWGKSQSEKEKESAKPRKKRSQTDEADFPSRIKRAASMPREDIPPDVPTNKADYHIMLIEEIERVQQHLRSEPPRKYTFKEWAWYLKLLGEDEGSSETHKKPVPHTLSKPSRKGTANSSDGARNGPNDANSNGSGSGEESSPPNAETSSALPEGGDGADGNKEHQDQSHVADANEEQRNQWSWIGARSPLMGSQEEAEWILQKLMQKLAQELKEARDSDGPGPPRRPLISERSS